VKVLRLILSLAVIATAMTTATLQVRAAEYGGGSAQGYAADTLLDNGTIVQLTGKNSNRVKIASQSDLQNMFGVTVDRNQLPLTVTNEGIQNETFVAVSGTYNVLVSTQGGAIAAGDYVTMSSVNGVAMKAGTEEKTVFGRAAAPFDGKGITLSSVSLKDSSGKGDKTVSLGLIAVTIDIRSNPNQKTTKANLPSFLERAGLMIAEKPVSPIRIYLSIGVASISVIAAIAIIYAGVRSGVISIGRNPMSKKSIFRALIETILTSLLILIVGMFAVYLLLKL
jgi:hypothetical protein